jgi:hypothetical protein
MDEIALRELIKSGVRLAGRKWQEQRAATGEDSLGTDSQILTVLDRFVQLGLIALDHRQTGLWSELLDGLLAVYRIGIPRQQDSRRPVESNTKLLVDVVHRVFLLGAAATKLKRFECVRALALGQPIEEQPGTYWIRHSVTMAARGEFEQAFKGKSLIGPASEFVRERPVFFGFFEENLDTVVNYMCEFDFLNCVATVAAENDIHACYPNFGGFFDYRTMPIVLDLVRAGASRSVIPGVDEPTLAGILRELDSVTRNVFFTVAGWLGYAPEVYEFIKGHSPRE